MAYDRFRVIRGAFGDGMVYRHLVLSVNSTPVSLKYCTNWKKNLLTIFQTRMGFVSPMEKSIYQKTYHPATDCR